tara:strand:- start:2841 stop:3284 length:444 start_codon:yes stop_codon:yes gene_type:complete
MELWIVGSYMAVVFFSTSILLKKYLYNDGCLLHDVLFIHFFVYGILSVLLSAYIYKIRGNDLFKCKEKNTKIIVLTSISSFFILLGVLAKETAYAKVINPAYVSTILGVGVALLIYIASITVFKKKVNMKGLVGILLSLIGLYLLTN